MLKGKENLEALVAACKNASTVIARASSAVKNRCLTEMADQLISSNEHLLQANQKDIENAEKNGLSGALVDRLILTPKRLAAMAQAIREIAQLPDPVGEISAQWKRPSGIQVGYMRIPLGVIGMIYESRPNVTSDAAALCLKSGNGVVLRGGSEAFYSNQAIAMTLHHALENTGLPRELITFIPTTDRAAIGALLAMERFIDLIIPRGGEGLIRFVAENSRIPVIKHYKGVCHLFVDKSANLKIALDLLLDGKLSRPGVCNALETLLVHEDAAEGFLSRVSTEFKKRNVEIRGCARTRQVIPWAAEATDDDYHQEYLSLIIAVKIVKDVDQAIEHIGRYGSNHTDVIVTNDLENSRRFLRHVDSAVVMVNASSRFSDGGELGLGAEIGISTTKLHAYGPMGLQSLTTRKFIVHGEGQTRHDVADL
jgi:glutamate-5-semialdehyde dehydrogenase